MTSRYVYVYRGSARVAKTNIPAGRLAQLSPSGALELHTAQGCGFLFIAGKPLKEPIVQHGPFVMSTKAQIQQCFRDFQLGNLAPKPCTYTTY